MSPPKLTSPVKSRATHLWSDPASLEESLRETVEWSQEQVERSRKLIENSQAIIARIDRSLARASQIQHREEGQQLSRTFSGHSKSRKPEYRFSPRSR